MTGLLDRWGAVLDYGSPLLLNGKQYLKFPPTSPAYRQAGFGKGRAMITSPSIKGEVGGLAAENVTQHHHLRVSE